MISLILTILSLIILVIGIASMVTPIPGGTIMISGGLTMLICTSPTARICIRFIREKSTKMNIFFEFLEKKIGTKIKVIGIALNKTRPGTIE
jgi:hypothetical protein